MKTKEKIEAATLQLFNNMGVENVTTRTVASKLGMSQGNLHYHYPNKNSLIEQLYADFKAGLLARSTYQTGAFDLKQIHESLHRNFEWMYQFRFLFVDREIIWRRLTSIKRETQTLIIIKGRQLREAIILLKTSGVFRKDMDDAQVDSFISTYQIMINSWLSAVYLFTSNDPATFFANHAFRAWYPYLTQKGKIEFEKIINLSLIFKTTF